MIHNTFDISSEPVLTLKGMFGEKKHICDRAIVTFSHEISSYALKTFDCEKIAVIRSCRGDMPVYMLEYRGVRVAFYVSPLGSAMAATTVAEASWIFGATKFVMFGSSGALDREKTEGRLVVPTAAYRDEGMSYHYAPAADYIDLPGAKKVSEVFDRLEAPYVLGKTWTTDAAYRETRAHMEARKREGCLAVEMEVAGVQAVCDFYGLELCNFLMTGDVLDLPDWDRAGLAEANHCLDNFRLALETAISI